MSVRGVQEAVLGCVVSGETHGYQIAKRLEQDWEKSAVYKALQRLREKGLIERASPADDRRKPYHPTPAGLRLSAARAGRLLAAREGTLASLLQGPVGRIETALDEAEQLILRDLNTEPAHPDPLTALLYLERRLINEAKLKWIAAVRERAGDATPLP